MKFSDLGLSDDVLRAVEDAGYTEPTPIQEQAIPIILMGRDVLGCAQTGTGKTAGFTLPMIDILARGRAKARMPRSLIIEPTRELAAQVAANFETYGKYHNLSKALLMGGTSFTEQEKALNRGVDVLIATPGRLLDLFGRGKILLSDVKVLVIDEADRMLDMGFIPDVERIVSLLPKLRQTLFFSATMPPEIRRLADAFLMNPKEISVAAPATTAETIEDFIVIVPERDKSEAIRRLLETENVKNALIFCNRKRDVDVLARSLKTHGFKSKPLHGDLAQAVRTETLAAFKSGEIPLLVASDVAARGLDISELPCVINFDVPYHAEDYVHRIGRTGRAGRSGRAFTLSTPAESKQIAAIERLIGRTIQRMEIGGVKAASAGPEDEAENGGSRPKRGRGPRTTTRATTRTKPVAAQAEPAVAVETGPAQVGPARIGPIAPAASAIGPIGPIGPLPARTTPKTAPETAAEAAPDAAPKPAPKPAPESAPETAPQAARHATPDTPRTAGGESRDSTRDEPTPAGASRRGRRRRNGSDRSERGGTETREGRVNQHGERQPPKVPADAPTIGMGDHMPAFLARPARADGNEG